MKPEKINLYDITKMTIDTDKNFMMQIQFSGKLDSILDMMKKLANGKFMLVSPRISGVPNDANKDKCKINQDASKVTMEGDDIIVSTSLDTLQEFKSTDPGQGTAKWIGLLINVGTDSIIGTNYGNYAFTQADVTDANSVGGVAGEFVIWIKAEEVVEKPYEFTLTRGSLQRTITIKVINN